MARRPTARTMRSKKVRRLNMKHGMFKQTGKRKSVSADRKRVALRPGYRVSKTGRIYSETRKNRTDRRGKRI